MEAVERYGVLRGLGNGCMAVAALSSFLPRWIGSGGENCGDSHIFAKSANDGALTLDGCRRRRRFGPAFNFYEEMMSY